MKSAVNRVYELLRMKESDSPAYAWQIEYGALFAASGYRKYAKHVPERLVPRLW